MQAAFRRQIGPIDNHIYNQALNETLRSFCHEDCTQHGRLLELKEILTNLNNGMRLDDKQLACLYAKDIAVVRKFSKIIPEAVTSITNNAPDAREISSIITNRAR